MPSHQTLALLDTGNLLTLLPISSKPLTFLYLRVIYLLDTYLGDMLMSKENKSKYAILGVLSYGPMSGYDIKKFIQQSISNFWSESYGQIYPILKQLTSEGLASSHTEKQEGKPERYMYALTGNGGEAWQQWLTGSSAHPSGRVEVLLQLFFGRHTAVSTSVGHVSRSRTAHVQLLQN